MSFPPCHFISPLLCAGIDEELFRSDLEPQLDLAMIWMLDSVPEDTFVASVEAVPPLQGPPLQGQPAAAQAAGAAATLRSAAPALRRALRQAAGGAAVGGAVLKVVMVAGGSDPLQMYSLAKQKLK